MRISDWSSDVCSSDLIVDAGRIADAEIGGFPDARRSVERRLDISHSAHFARYCPSAFEIGGGHAPVGIGGERTCDQRVESWLVIEPQPAWRQRRLRPSARGPEYVRWVRGNAGRRCGRHI